MLQTLHEVVSLHTTVWLLPIAFMFHDLEEIVMVENWMRRNGDELRRFLPPRLAAAMERDFGMNTLSFAIAVSFMFAGVALSTVWTGLSLDHGGSLLPFAAVLAVFFVHAFMHMVQALLFRRYTPGVVTSIVIVVPYSLYSYYRMLADGLFTWNTIALGLPIGFLCVVPLLVAGHRTGKRLSGRAL